MTTDDCHSFADLLERSLVLFGDSDEGVTWLAVQIRNAEAHGEQWAIDYCQRAHRNARTRNRS